MRNKEAALNKLTNLLDIINEAFFAGALSENQYDAIASSIISIEKEIKEDK